MTSDHGEPDYYAVLEVAPGARPNVIDAAWRQMVKDYHPDLHPGDPAMERRIKRINEAHDLLSDAATRAAYDRRRAEVRHAPRGEAAPGAAYEPGRPAAGSKPSAKRRQRPSAPSVPWAAMRRWAGRTVRWHLLPWLIQTRLGQWVAVVAAGALAASVATAVPTLDWTPGGAFIGAFVISSLIFALWARSFWGSPLGDVISVVVDLVRGLL